MSRTLSRERPESRLLACNPTLFSGCGMSWVRSASTSWSPRRRCSSFLGAPTRCRFSCGTAYAGSSGADVLAQNVSRVPSPLVESYLTFVGEEEQNRCAAYRRSRRHRCQRIYYLSSVAAEHVDASAAGGIVVLPAHRNHSRHRPVLLGILIHDAMIRPIFHSGVAQVLRLPESVGLVLHLSFREDTAEVRRGSGGIRRRETSADAKRPQTCAFRGVTGVHLSGPGYRWGLNRGLLVPS